MLDFPGFEYLWVSSWLESRPVKEERKTPQGVINTDEHFR